MKYLVLIAASATMLATSLPAPAFAGPGIIDRACRQTNRPSATPTLCRCLQKVAESELSLSERKRVARWFNDPHQAQVTRQSDRSSDEKLWKRHKAFAAQAKKTCG